MRAERFKRSALFVFTFSARIARIDTVAPLRSFRFYVFRSAEIWRSGETIRYESGAFQTLFSFLPFPRGSRESTP